MFSSHLCGKELFFTKLVNYCPGFILYHSSADQFVYRLNGSHMLELLRGKRLVFVGDSLNRNMWESLICILKNSAKDKSKVYEASGHQHFRTEPSYSFIFKVIFFFL